MSLAWSTKLWQMSQDYTEKHCHKQTSKQIALKFEVDPSILGGVVLQVGDNVLDASLRAQLAILRDIIKRGE